MGRMASDASHGHHYFKFTDKSGQEQTSYKECVGDMQDINTLFEMVQESVGTTAILRKEFYDDRQERGKQLTQFKSETLQLLQQHLPNADQILPQVGHYEEAAVQKSPRRALS